MRGFAIDVTELMRRHAEGAGEHHNPALPEAEAMTLQERFTELNDNPVALTPGMLVTYKPGFEQRKPEWAGHPMMVADIDVSGYPLPKFSAQSYVFRPDTAVLDLRPDGTAGIALLDHRWLKQWEPAPAIGPAPEPEPLPPPPRKPVGQETPDELKPEAMDMFAAGMSARDVHDQLGIALSLASRWVEEFRLKQDKTKKRRRT